MSVYPFNHDTLMADNGDALLAGRDNTVILVAS